MVVKKITFELILFFIEDSGFSTLNGANECDTDPDLRIALNRTKLKNDESLNTTVCGGEHNSDDEAVFADGFDGENGQRVRRRKTSTLDQSNLSIKKSKKQSNLAAVFIYIYLDGFLLNKILFKFKF